MTIDWTPEHLDFARSHTWAVLATGRADGSPQQSMVGYVVDDSGRILVSVKSYTAKWKNAVRQPKVSLTVPDDRTHLVIYGDAEAVSDDPLRAELTAQVFGGLFGGDTPDPNSIVPMLDEQQRTVLIINPTKTMLHD